MTIAKAQQLPAAIAALLDAAAVKYGISQSLARAVAWIESKGDPKAESPEGARGVMQLMPVAAKDLHVTNVFDPAENIDAGVKFLARLIDRFGDEGIALAAYNWGTCRRGGCAERNGRADPGKCRGYARKVQARKAEEEGSRTSGIPFFGSSQVHLLCPHCSREWRINIELEIRR